MKNKNIIIPALSFMAGIIVGMMYAPEKGTKFRKDFGCAVKSIADIVDDLDIDCIKKTLESSLDDIKDMITNLEEEKSKTSITKKWKMIKQELEDIKKDALDIKDELLIEAVNKVKKEAEEKVEKLLNTVETSTK